MSQHLPSGTLNPPGALRIGGRFYAHGCLDRLRWTGTAKQASKRLCNLLKMSANAMTKHAEPATRTSERGPPEV